MKRYLFFIVFSAAIILAACTSNSSIPQTGPTGAAPAILTTAPAVETAAATIMASTQPTTAPSGTQASQPSATCTAPAALTPALTEGPYWKSGSPERASLLDSGVTGTKLVLTGQVLDASCQPVAHAWLDFWQANAQGQYDNSGYTLRGHQFTDAQGRYTLTTIIPGLYPGRTEHIHVKVQAPNGPILTTQLFFPGVQQNSEDGIFDPALVLPMQAAADGQTAVFNFVINTK